MPKLLRLLALILLCGLATGAQLYYNNCPPEVDAKSATVRAPDKLKNRDAAPTPEQINKAVTLDALLKPGNDRGRWKVNAGAEVVGYVWDVKASRIESSKCHLMAVDDRDRLPIRVLQQNS
jgi:hypothetical protein